MIKKLNNETTNALSKAIGLLSTHQEYRSQQLQMCQFLRRFMNYARTPGHTALIEAGTGLGKSFGYLVAASEWLSTFKENMPRIIIGTNTLNLQEQLIRKDIPIINSCYPNINFVKAKGRNNYVCLRKFIEVQTDLFNVNNEQQRKIGGWLGSAEGASGERSDVNFDLNQGFWKSISSDTVDCLGLSCPQYKKCYYNTAKTQVEKADIIIATHALILTDFKQKHILPQYDLLILDEAHNFENNAINAFTTNINRKRLMVLLNLSNMKYCQIGFRTARIFGQIQQWQKSMRVRIDDFILSLDEGRYREPEVSREGQNLIGLIKDLYPFVEKAISKTEVYIAKNALTNLFTEAQKLSEDLQSWLNQDKSDFVYWVENREAKFVPIDISPFLSPLWRSTNSVLTSATLAVNKRFDLAVRTLGIDQKRCYTQQLDSPFNHKENAIVYLPARAKSPKSNGYAQYLSSIVEPVLRKTNGKTFILFTSFASLNEVHKELKSRLGDQFTWLIQGTNTRERLLALYRANQNSVLMGTNAFWEGVDEDIDCVVITKLPFKVPSSPLEEARYEKVKSRGLNPFAVHSLPQCAIRLKQGTGRLIRHSKKRGVIVMCDPRINETWGKVIINTLPEMKWTRNIDEIDLYLPQKKSA